AESEDLYENLDRLERWAGIQIVRIVPELGLVDYINKYNGFLPSQQARWCTPKLKIEPLDEWFKQNYDLGGNDMIWTHVRYVWVTDTGSQGSSSWGHSHSLYVPNGSEPSNWDE